MILWGPWVGSWCQGCSSPELTTLTPAVLALKQVPRLPALCPGLQGLPMLLPIGQGLLQGVD